MADHRAKQIIDAVTTALTGLPTTGTNVVQSRVYAVDSLPALTIRMGAETTRQISQAFIDREFELFIDIHVKANEPTIDDQLLEIRKEVYSAMMADITFGLPFVIDLEPSGASEPTLDSESDRPTAELADGWRVVYRHSISNADA